MCPNSIDFYTKTMHKKTMVLETYKHIFGIKYTFVVKKHSRDSKYSGKKG